MAPFNISPALLDSLWESLPATSSLFGNDQNGQQQKAQPQTATPQPQTATPAPQAPAAAPLATDPLRYNAQQAQNVVQTATDKVNAPQQPDPNAYPSTGWGVTDWLNKHVLEPFVPYPKSPGYKDQQKTQQQDQQNAAAMAPAQAKVTAPPTPPASAYQDSTTIAANASKPNVPAAKPTDDLTPPDISAVAPQGGENPLANLFAGQTTAQPKLDPHSAVDYGKSNNNLALESGQAAPIPARPFVPGSRDINPSTNQPFNTKDWNMFMKPSEGAPFGRRPDDGRPFVDAAEQQAYAKNNNIDLGSFANKHHTLQNILGLVTGVVGDAATRMAGGPSGYSEAVRNSPALQQIAAQTAAKTYDANRPAVQAEANFTRQGQQILQSKNAAAAESEMATAKQKEAQTQAFQQFNLSGAKDGFGNPLMGHELFDYIQKNNPGMAADLQAYHFGDKNPSDLSTRPGMQNPQSRQAFSQIARSVWANGSENIYQQRQGVQKSFTSGDDAKTIAALNTAVQHMSMVKQLADAQKNGQTQFGNTFINYVKTQLGHPEVNDTATAANALSGELANIFKQSGATDQEIASIKGNLDPSKMSPEQMQGWIQTAMSLMAGRMNAVNQKWQNQYADDDPRKGEAYKGTLSSANSQILAGLPGGDKLVAEATGKPAQPGAPAQATPAQEQPVYVKGKLTGYTTDGKTYSRKVQ